MQGDRRHFNAFFVEKMLSLRVLVLRMPWHGFYGQLSDSIVDLCHRSRRLIVLDVNLSIQCEYWRPLVFVKQLPQTLEVLRFVDVVSFAGDTLERCSRLRVLEVCKNMATNSQVSNLPILLTGQQQCCCLMLTRLSVCSATKQSAGNSNMTNTH